MADITLRPVDGRHVGVIFERHEHKQLRKICCEEDIPMTTAVRFLTLHALGNGGADAVARMLEEVRGE